MKSGSQREGRHSGLMRKMRSVWKSFRRSRTVVVVMFVAHVAGALTSVRAIMNGRTSQGATAWAISLNTVPLIAVPTYWVFGRHEFNGYIVARRGSMERGRHIRENFMASLKEQGLVARPEQHRPRHADKLADLPFTTGNSADLLIDGEMTYQSIFDGIDRAENYLLVQFYIIKDDDTGRQLKSRMIAAAKKGVRCFLLYDEIGTRIKSDDAYFNEMRKAGIEVHPFNTTKGRGNRFQINFRNHRKIVVVDGQEAWVGGLNVGDEYRGLDPDFGFWRDTHLHLTGPVVPCIQVSFIEDWRWATDAEGIEGLSWLPVASKSGESKSVLCLPTGPVDTLEYCTLFFLEAINSAKERLWIATPYFVPDEQFISALHLAELRGVDVKILIPAKNNSRLVQYSAWSYLDELEKGGIEVYRYEKGFMHHKVVLVDDDLATIGTANFDNRSFRLNFEITMAVVDRGFNEQVATMLEHDFNDSARSYAKELEKKGFWFRFLVEAARLTAPIQ